MQELAAKKVHHFYVVIGFMGIIGAVLLFFGFAGKEWFQGSAPQSENQITQNQTVPPPQPQASGIGAEIYNQVQNPLENRLPENSAPATNPVSAMYKNPFE